MLHVDTIVREKQLEIRISTAGYRYSICICNPLPTQSHAHPDAFPARYSRSFRVLLLKSSCRLQEQYPVCCPLFTPSENSISLN